jgi:ribosomal-protein-alanine N-acetyltransferase
MIRIREVQEADIPSVLELERAAFSPPWSERALLDQVGREDGFFAVAVREDETPGGGTVLGFVITRRAADETELYQIAVREACRRQGIAGLLMEAVLEDSRRHDAASVYLEVRAGNTAAIGLYEKFGFTVAGRRKNYYSNPVEDALVMSLLLKKFD